MLEGAFVKISDYLLKTLHMNGVHFIFGNPGTTEISLVRRCGHAETPAYVIALNELAAVAMADGYARATRALGVVNLHAAPGLGNGIGALYTAQMNHTPLLAIVGAQDQRHAHTVPTLHGPLVEMAAPVAKATYTLASPYDAPFHIKQALRTALTAPFGPVVLTCPLDLWEAEIEDSEETPVSVTVPALPGVNEYDAQLLAQFLGDAHNPALIVTDEVYWNKAEHEVASLATKLGAPVYVAPYTGVMPLSSADPQFAGFLPPNRQTWTTRLQGHDALFFLGGKGLRATLYTNGRLLQKKAWIGQDTSLLGLDGEYVLARVADLRSSLRLIHEKLSPAKPHGGSVTRPSFTLPSTISGKLHPSSVVHTLLRAFPRAVWVDESGLSTTDVRGWIMAAAGDYFSNGSGGIGWALPATVGVQMAHSDRHIIGIIGDGSMMYASEAMWTAAHQHLRITVIVLVNTRYATLNTALYAFTGQTALDAFSLDPPAIGFAHLAQAYGWSYACIETMEALHRALAELPTQSGGNTLLEVRLDPDAVPITASEHF
jgi:benzoylformate decarboxylase